jgi:RNA polymerase sigma factor (sigma-70 family)
MSLTSKTNSSLINDCINGNRKSQKELYNSFAPAMYAICLRYSRNQMDAEDILQNGFIKLFNNLHKYRGEGSFEGWVRRIFVNSAIEHIRDKKINVTVDIASQEFIPYTHVSALDTLYQKDLIKKADALSDGYRTVFKLYAVEGLSHKEIAEYLGISESTSKSQYSRAKAILRDIIAALSKPNPQLPLIYRKGGVKTKDKYFTVNLKLGIKLPQF